MHVRYRMIRGVLVRGMREISFLPILSVRYVGLAKLRGSRVEKQPCRNALLALDSDWRGTGINDLIFFLPLPRMLIFAPTAAPAAIDWTPRWYRVMTRVHYKYYVSHLFTEQRHSLASMITCGIQVIIFSRL